MKKLMITLLILYGIVFATWRLAADTEMVDGIEWNYTVANGVASIEKWDGAGYYLPAIPTSTSGPITIPSTLGGYPVTTIRWGAFKGCSDLTSVTIPSSVTDIGIYIAGLPFSYEAFYGCSGLRNVTAPQCVCSGKMSSIFPAAYQSITNVVILDSVTNIGSHAFYGCSGLTSLTIPDGVTSIGHYAFYGCSGLTSVIIPNSVTGIVEGAFSGCSGIRYVEVPECACRPYLASYFTAYQSITNVVISFGASSVSEGLFTLCSALEQVSVPETVVDGKINLTTCNQLKSMKLGYTCHGECVPTRVYVDDELMLSAAETGVYEWMPRSIGTHVIRRVTGPYELTISVNCISCPDIFNDKTPNPPGELDETISLASERKEFANAKRSANTVSVTSTTGSGTWSASVSDDWISLAKTTGAVGTDKVSYIVEANASAQARIGYVYVSGHVHTVIQPGTGVSVGPDMLSIDCLGGEQTLAVDTTVGDAPWTARPNDLWISVQPTSGIGDGEVTVGVLPFYEVAIRTGSAMIAGETMTITQRGRDMALAHNSTNCAANAQSVSVDVMALADVPWAVVSGANWITVTYAGSGQGNSVVDLALSENTSYLSRTGMVAIGTETFTVTQAGVASPMFDIASSAVSVPATATSAKTVKITATPDLPWTISSGQSWLAPLNNFATGSGTKTIAYSVAANPTLAPRTGTLTFTPDIASGLPAKTLTVTQAAAVSSIDSSSASVSAAAATVTVGVTVDSVVGWTVSSSAGWITLEGMGSRTGPGSVVLHISENTSLIARDGTVTVAGHVFAVHQAGGVVGISSNSSSVSASGGTVYIEVSGSENLNWSIQNAASWVVVEGDTSRKGPTTLIIRVDTNTGTEARSCEIMIGGQTLTIEQSAAGTSVEADVLVYGPDTDIGLFSVDAPAYLTWQTTTVDDEWIILTSDAVTTGSGDVEYIVDEIDNGKSRIGVIWVGTTPVYICQTSFETLLSETSREVSRVSASGQIAVTVGDGNQWCAMSTVPWITLVNTNGIGNGIVQFNYGDNSTGIERTGRIIVVDQVFTLTQTDVDPSVPHWSIVYDNLKGAVNPNPSKYYAGYGVTFQRLSDISGYTFAGWTPSSIPADATGDKVVTASWNWIPQDAVVEASITGGKALTVDAEWVKTELDQVFGADRQQLFIAKFGDNFAAALTKKTGKRDSAGNELAVWHDYIAGTDPTDVNSIFKAKIEIRDGMPIIEWEPNLNSNGEKRVYTVYGKAALADAWHSPTNALDHFFKVDVAMPQDGTITFNVGGGSSVDPIAIRVGQPIGELPTPTRQGYDFLGWFTAAEGGTEITPETVVADDMTIFAHWMSAKPTWYVNGSTGSDSNSGRSDSSAKATIQAAVDAASAGDTILVAPGTYGVFSTLNKQVDIQGVGGSAQTFIDGNGSANTKGGVIDLKGSSSSVTTNTVIEGFTIQNITRVDGGTLKRCLVRNNNTSSVGGGALNGSVAENCLIVNNCGMNGSAADGCILRNCTMVGNTASSGYKGVCLNSCLENCIVYGNGDDSRQTWQTWFDQNPLVSSYPYREMNVYAGNPHFVDAANGNYRLMEDSPCINAGGNSYVTGSVDLDGNPRIVNGTVDIGCYEH